jgi:hypothetical protein
LFRPNLLLESSSITFLHSCYKEKQRLFIAREKELAEETFNWIYVGFTPLLYEKNRVARQSKIETWLDLFQLVKELNIEKTENKRNVNPTMSYVI